MRHRKGKYRRQGSAKIADRVNSDALSAFDFEKQTAEAFSLIGWSTSLTSKSRDYGADVCAICGSETLVVQCKAYNSSSSVPFSAVQEIVFAKIHFKASECALVYSGRLTSQAYSAAIAHSVHLLRINEIIPGCSLDRSLEGAIYKQMAAAPLVVTASRSWVEHDDLLIQWKGTCRTQRNWLLLSWLSLVATTALVWKLNHPWIAVGIFFVATSLLMNFGPVAKPSPLTNKRPSPKEIERAERTIVELDAKLAKLQSQKK